MPDSKVPNSSEQPDDSRIDFESTEYQLAPDVVPSDVDTGGDEHPIKQALGADHDEQFKYDAKLQGKRVAFRYDSPLAALREYVANMETACIRTARLKLQNETVLSDAQINDMDPWTMLRAAEDECDYHPEIHIHKSGIEAPMPDLIMSDNGVGISIEEYLIIEHVGLSKNHAEGNFAGEMGQGLMSAFNICGEHGFFRFITKSRLDDANYGEKVHIDRMKDIAGERDDYGTTFEFPAMTEEMHDLDLRNELEDICQLVRVPVFFEEFDNEGKRVTSASEEFLPQRLDDLVPENEPSITYEDEMVMAVAAPSLSKRGGPGVETYMTCQPIERRGYRVTNSQGAPWKWHLWLKREDGPIWQCNCDGEDHSGLVPIERPGYKALDEDDQARHVDKSEIDMDEHVLMPDPVDDKDRLNSGFDDFYSTVGSELGTVYTNEARAAYEELAERGFEGLPDMDDDVRQLLFKSYSDFGPNSAKAKGPDVKMKIKKNLGVELDDETAAHIAATREDADWARRSRSAHSVSRARRRDQDHKISDVIEAAGEDGEIFMAKTLTSADKINLAWELHPDNQVIAVSTYEYYEEQFGWSKLKDFDLYNIRENYPDLDTQTAKQLEKTRSNSSSSTSKSTGTNDRDPAERFCKVRSGTGMGKYKRTRGKTVKDALSGDEGQVRCKGLNYSTGTVTADRLLLYKQTEHSADVGSDLVRPGVAYAVVPNYLYDYLVDADRVFTDPAELAKDIIADTNVVTLDISDRLAKPAFTNVYDDDPNHVRYGEGTFEMDDVNIGELTDDDVVLHVSRKDQARFLTMATGVNPDFPADVFHKRLAEIVDEAPELNTKSRLVFLTTDQIEANWPAFSVDMIHGDEQSPYTEIMDSTPTIYAYRRLNTGANIGYKRFRTHNLTDFKELLLEYKYPPEDYDRSAPEWKRFGPSSLEDEQGIRFIEQMEAGAPDDGALFPSQRGDA